MTHFPPFRSLLLAGGLLLGSAVIAQDDEPPIPPERLQEIKAQKSAYLTQKMGLTPEESQKFWPVYNQFDKELDALRKERRDVHRSMRADGDVSEAEATAAIEKELASQQRELDLRKRYSADFIKSVGARKTLLLARSEREFNRELLRRMKERAGDRPSPPPGDRR